MSKTNRPKASAPIVSSAHADLHAVRPRYGDDTGFPVKIAQHPRVAIGPEANFALACIERWAMVAAELDGEDSAGRAKLRRMSPDEVVAHACDCAAKAFAAFKDRGWVIDVPSMAELAEAVKDQENNNE